MQTDTLMAPVGRDMNNAPADVDVVRRMLRANGFMVAEVGGVDGGLLKAIEAAQKKAGLKTPDGVIDPDGRTADWLRPKFRKAEAALADEAARLAEMKLVEVKLAQETLVIRLKDHERLVNQTLDRLERYCDSLIRIHDRAQECYGDILDIEMMEQGVVKAVFQAVVVRSFAIRHPDEGLMRDSARAAMDLRRAMAKRSLQALIDTLPVAEVAIQAFMDDVQRFYREYGGTAGSVGEVAKITSTYCFVAVVALAPPAIVLKAPAISLTTATVMANAGVATLSSLSKELGDYASGKEVSLGGASVRVFIDTVIGGIAGWVGAKLPTPFTDKLARQAAMTFGASFPGVGSAQVKLFFYNYLSGSGAEGTKACVTEALGLLGKMLKPGVEVKEKDFEDALQGVVVAFLGGGLVKNMGAFGKSFEDDATAMLSRNMVPDAIKRLVSTGALSDKQARKITADAINAVFGEVQKTGWNAVVDTAKGDENPTALTQIALKAVAADRAVQVMLEKELVKALKKAKIPLK